MLPAPVLAALAVIVLAASLYAALVLVLVLGFALVATRWIESAIPLYRNAIHSLAHRLHTARQEHREHRHRQRVEAVN